MVLDASLTQKLKADPEIQTVLTVTSFNLLGASYKSPTGALEMKLHEKLTEWVLEVAGMALVEPVEKPVMTLPVWRKQFAVDCENAIMRHGFEKRLYEISAEVVKEFTGVVEERAENVLFFYRVATASGQIVTMLYHGWDSSVLVEKE